MDKGKIQQFDTPRNIVRNPANDFVRSLINSAKGQEIFLED